jgi:hypothetical protein
VEPAGVNRAPAVRGRPLRWTVIVSMDSSPGRHRASSLRRRRGTGRPPRDQCFRRQAAITCKSSFLGLIYGPGVLLAPQDYAARTTQVIRYQAAGRFLPGRHWLGCDNEIPAEARWHSEILS